MKKTLVIENIGLKYDRIFNTGIDRAIKNAMMVEDIGKRYAGIFDSGISETIGNIDMGHIKELSGVTVMLAETAGIIKRFENSNYRNIIESSSQIVESMKMNYASIVDKTNYAGLISGLTKFSGTLGAIENSKILGLNSFIQTWQSSMDHMPKTFTTNYNNLVANTLNDLGLKMETINSNRNIKHPTSDELVSIIGKFDEIIEDADIAELTEGLESEVDWQEIENIANGTIEEIIRDIDSEESPLIYIITLLMEEVVGSSIRDTATAKISANDNLLQIVFFKILMFLISVLIQYHCIKLASDSRDRNRSIKEIEKGLKALDVYDEILSEKFRLVMKDKLEVRESNKMKSRIKYHLNFGRLAKMERKHKNWTKVIYTDIYTKEIEIGWVLTRYIKRLD